MDPSTKEHIVEAVEHRKGEYALIIDVEEPQLSIYDKPLPCFGCGIGWFSLLLGFVFPLMWYYATILYFGNYYRKDPRERAGLAASAIAVIPRTKWRDKDVCSCKPGIGARKRKKKENERKREPRNH